MMKSIARFFTICMAFAAVSVAEPKESLIMQNPHPIVELQTTAGNIKLELYSDKAPKTVENFLQYVKSGHYNGTIFHRVINGFMIQGGNFDKEMNQKPHLASVVNEAENGLKNDRGTIAMARTSDVNSAADQFFINVSDNAFLNFRGKSPQEYGYCVFGKVIEGMDTVDKIKAAKTTTKSGHSDVPVEAIEITKAFVVES